MKIRRLTLHNFGIYTSDNNFILNDEKPVVLIGGMNGRGKTTFLEAVLLSLYGSNSFAFQESKHKSYSSYLKAHTNETDGTLESFVELEFTIIEDNVENNYIVNRCWNTKAKYTKDKVSIIKNGNKDKFLTQNWTMFIESILPSALSNFYFFDGEKIAELAESETSEQMKNSIKSLLGIKVIDLLENDLTRIIRRLESEGQKKYFDVNLEVMRNKKEEKKSELQFIDSEICELENKLSKLLKKIDKKTEQFHAKGGLIASQSHALYNERLSLNTQLKQIQNGFLETASGELPLRMVKDLLQSVQQKSIVEIEQKSVWTAVAKIDEMYDNYIKQNSINDDNILNFIKYVKKQASPGDESAIFSLSDNAHAQNMLLINGKLDNDAKDYLTNKSSAQKIASRIAEIDNYLSVDIDEKAIQRIYKQMRELQVQKTDLEIQLENKKKQRVTVNGEYLSASTEFNRCVEEVILNMERGDDVERILKYALLAQAKSAEFKIALQKSKIDDLANTMTKCYKKLLGKKNLIDRISMDVETLDYHYLDSDGKEIMKSSLSAGEKQLMIISMLWALAECSNKLLPVIIDTPLARLDKMHRKALLEKYFPNASSQTIILSTDSEIDSESYQIIKPFISNEFTLIYDEDHKRSCIKKGYFEEI